MAVLERCGRPARIVRKLTAAELRHSLNVQSLTSIWSLMKRTLALLAVLGLMQAPAALAQGQDQGWGNQFSPGEAREAVKEGRTVPLSKIFQSLKREYGGYQLGADLYSQDSGGAVYEIDWLTDDGRKVHVTVDAQTGAIISRSGG